MLSQRDIVEKILSVRQDLTERALNTLIQKKMEGAGRLLTEEGATYMVANELGIDLSNGNVVGTGMKIKDLIIGANDATITGVVLAVSTPQTFMRKDGVEGAVARLVVSDDTGTMNVVLWNEKTRVLTQENISPQQVIRISHGYVRAGLSGRPELNVGRRGTVVLLTSPPSRTQDPSTNYLTKIRDLAEGDFVTFRGVVQGHSPISSFTRSNNRPGQVMRVRLADETGRIRAVFWDDKVDDVRTSQRGDVLEIVSGLVRRGLGSVLEVHVGRLGHVKVVEDVELAPRLSATLTKIANLAPGMNDVDVLGRVMDVGPIREFERRSGGVGQVGSLYVLDDTGSVRLTLWNEKTDVLADVAPDDVVLAEGGYTREGLGGVVELNLGGMGRVTLNPELEASNALPHFSSTVMSIRELKVGMRSMVVEGRVMEAPVVKDVTTRAGAELRVASLRLQDETGEVRVSLWRDLADEVEGLPEGSRLRIKNAYVKMGFFGDLELSSGTTTELEVLQRAEAAPDAPGDRVDALFSRKIDELKAGERAEVQGTIVEINANSRIYPSCPNCKKRATEAGGGWSCERCGVIPAPVPRLIVEVVVQNDSGRLNSVFSGAAAEMLLGMSGDDAWAVFIQAGSEVAPIELVREKILGAKVQLVGRAGRSRRDGNLRLYVEQITVV
jgi:replication factor A1